MDDLARQRLRVYLLAICQALFLTCAVASVSVAAIVGADLAPRPWLSTLPYGLQFAVVILCAYPVSRMMGAMGRRPAFLIGSCFAMVAGLLGFWAIQGESFVGLILSHILLGIFITHANYYRFAATDGVRDELKSRAVSLVTSGGVLAGIIAPLLTLEAGQLFASQTFAHSYLLFSIAGLLSFGVLLLVPDLAGTGAAPGQPAESASPAPLPSIARTGIILAIYCAGAGYLVMNLLMVQSTLVLNTGSASHNVIGVAIQLHVVCMFLPSFFTGRLMERFGHRQILGVGFILLVLSSLVGMLGTGASEVILSLVILGVAWNFLYVGGSAFLTLCHSSDLADRVQGVNDTVVSTLAAVGALSAGWLFHFIGWINSLALAIPIAIVGLAMLAWFEREAAVTE